MAETEPAELFRYDRPVEGAFLDAVEMRNYLTALARTHYTTDSANPANAQDGQPRINAEDPDNVKLEVFLDGNWRTAIQRIDKGIAAPVKSIVQFATAGTPWVIDHNLGSQVVVQVFDASFIRLQPVNTFPTVAVPLAQVDATLAAGAALTGWPLPFNGSILSTFAVVEGAALPGGGLSVDFDINGTPVTGGDIPLVVTPTGGIINGNPVTASNVFAAGDLINLTTVGAPLAGGRVKVWANMLRTLNAGEYRLTQVNENRVTIDHPAATAGFAVLVG
jgi:hypothetical protein